MPQVWVVLHHIDTVAGRNVTDGRSQLVARDIVHPPGPTRTAPPPRYRWRAYVDHDLPSDHGRGACPGSRARGAHPGAEAGHHHSSDRPDHDVAGHADAPAGAVVERGRLVTACVPNEFPRLPVHQGVSVGAWLLADRSGGTAAGEVADVVATAAALPVQRMRLAPTARST